MTIRALPLLLLLAACSAPQEWVREYDGYLPGTGYPTHGVVLVRNRTTQQPIADALIRQHEEAWPSPEGKWAGLLAEARTDEYGLAWVELGEHPSSCHWAVYADGYAPTEEYARYVSAEVELERGHRMHGRIINLFGEPVAGAHVEYKLGCAHAPALAETTTDATGRFLFHGITDGDFTYTKPGVLAGYAHGAPVDEKIPIEYAGFGDRVTGRVLDRDGKPPYWAVVHYEGGGRGELALLDKNGSFELTSADSSTSLTLYTDEGYVQIHPGRFAPGWQAVHHLEPRVEEKFDVTVDVESFEDDQIEVSLTSLDTGRVYTRMCGNAFSVPRGRYRVGVGTTFSSHRGTGRIIKVDRHFPVTVKAVEQPRLHVEWEEPELADGDVQLAMRVGWKHWNTSEEEEPIHLPAEGRAVLWVTRMGVDRFIEVGPVEDGVRTARVVMPGVKRIRLPRAIWDEIDEIHFEDLDLEEMEDDEDRGLYRTRAVGRHEVVLEYSEGSDARTTIDLPEHADGEIVLDGFERIIEPDEDESERTPLETGDASIRLIYPEELGSELRVYLDGQMEAVDWRDADARIESLSPGPHTLICGAPGRKHFIYRIVLKRGETRVISLDLPLRTNE